ncbi:MAG: PLP-dependent aminotransferase family protein [Caldilineaceae bacterium]
MSKHTTTFDLAAIMPDPASKQSLYHQLYHALRLAILDGRLGRGARLPSTRELSATLGVARNTVMTAFDQLLAEGYLESRVGDGTYVSPSLPDELLHVRPPDRFPPQPLPATEQLSARYRAITSAPMGGYSDVQIPRAFGTGIPALDAFPYALWARLVARQWRAPQPQLLTYGDAAGYRPLRDAITEYLGTARGVRCTADQVLITAGSQHALDLVAQVLLDPGDTVWFEDPGYRGARAALLGSGAQLHPVPVDHEGLSVAHGLSTCPTARMAYVTPSHQYPTGVTMSLARRLALLEWAQESNAWILEDDYDSEYRYLGRPLSSLQGLDKANRVLYIGTFSKVLYPGLRLGYLVTPPALTAPFTRALQLAHRHLSVFDQAVLADFINEGHFARHIRRMRALYAERQDCFVRTLQQELGDYLTVDCAEAGLHLVAWLSPNLVDHAVAQAARQQGVEVAPISAYTMQSPVRAGLVLGYAMLDEAEMRAGVQGLKRAVIQVEGKG